MREVLLGLGVKMLVLLSERLRAVVNCRRDPLSRCKTRRRGEIAVVYRAEGAGAWGEALYLSFRVQIGRGAGVAELLAAGGSRGA
jgi:hypothetical protein